MSKKKPSMIDQFKSVLGVVADVGQVAAAASANVDEALRRLEAMTTRCPGQGFAVIDLFVCAALAAEIRAEKDAKRKELLRGLREEWVSRAATLRLPADAPKRRA